MSKQDLSDRIRTEKQNTASVDDQIAVAHAMYDERVTPNGDEQTQRELEGLFEGLHLAYALKTCLDHLIDIEIVETVAQNGPDTYIIHERRDEIVNGEDLEELVGIEIEALIRHIRSDDPADEGDTPAVADGGQPIVREVVSDGLNVRPESVVDYLRVGETFDRFDKLSDAIDTIEESDDVEKRDAYDKITFRRSANRYRLTETAVEVRERAD